jgi:hypothetical protein
MNKNRLVKSFITLVVLITVLSSAYAAFAQSSKKDDVMRVEVAEDGARFAFMTERLHEDGMPDYGSPFVTQGYIYPEGTLNGSNGVLPNGEPEFPELVLGEWTCYGWMIGDGAHTTTGKWVVSTQVYEFNSENGNSVIVTDGFEIADFNVPVERAVTGGTYNYRNAEGMMTQTLLGFTEAMGVNLTVEFELE